MNSWKIISCMKMTSSIINSGRFFNAEKRLKKQTWEQKLLSTLKRICMLKCSRGLLSQLDFLIVSVISFNLSSLLRYMSNNIVLHHQRRYFFDEFESLTLNGVATRRFCCCRCAFWSRKEEKVIKVKFKKF